MKLETGVKGGFFFLVVKVKLGSSPLLRFGALWPPLTDSRKSLALLPNRNFFLMLYKQRQRKRRFYD